MDRAETEDKIGVIKQAMGAVAQKIDNLKEIARDPSVPDDQKIGIGNDIVEAQERLEALREQLYELKGKPGGADRL